jgi:hypothetical protein
VVRTRAGDWRRSRTRKLVHRKRLVGANHGVVAPLSGTTGELAGGDHLQRNGGINVGNSSERRNEAWRRSRRRGMLPGGRRRGRFGRRRSGSVGIGEETRRPRLGKNDRVVDSRRAMTIRWTRMISETRRSSWCSRHGEGWPKSMGRRRRWRGGSRWCYRERNRKKGGEEGGGGSRVERRWS